VELPAPQDKALCPDVRNPFVTFEQVDEIFARAINRQFSNNSPDRQGLCSTLPSREAFAETKKLRLVKAALIVPIIELIPGLTSK